ncbi:MAG: PAS sensor protein, partial [Actinobacteria bacterium]|nr:PAS sensor protein [Actinomycetota bacterium]
MQEQHALGALATLHHRSRAEPSASGPSSELRCLGGLSLRLRGRDVDLGRLKPRARSLLRLLAMHEGRPVHREVLMEALWPECDLFTGGRNLQVL